MQKPLNTNLPADLPENWQIDDTVSPSGTDVGLTEKHGYNYQSKQINEAHTAINKLNEAFGNAQDNLETLSTDTTISDAHTIPVVQSTTVKKRITFVNLVEAIKSKLSTVFAALSHSHGNITNSGSIGSAADQAIFTETSGKLKAGVLPTAAGGTGNSEGTVAKLTTSRTIQVNLNSTAAASFDGSANATPGVTGALPVANGGTGSNNAATARSNLGITPANIGAAPATHTHNASDINAGTLSTDRLSTLPIAKGGTGATSPDAARTNLGAAPISHTHSTSDITGLTVGKLKTNTNADTFLDIYLSPSGNDSATGLTDMVPMKSIRAAVGKYGGLNRIRLNLSAGTYTDTSPLLISGNCYVAITGTSVVIAHPIIFQSTDVSVFGVTFDLNAFAETYPAITIRQAKYDIQNCVFRGRTTVHAGINVSLGSSGYIYRCNFQSGIRAVEIGSGASMTALENSIANVFEIGFNVNGGMLISGGNTNNAVTKFTMYNSAVIFDDGQLLNPVRNTVATANLVEE